MCKACAGTNRPFGEVSQRGTPKALTLVTKLGYVVEGAVAQITLPPRVS